MEPKSVECRECRKPSEHDPCESCEDYYDYCAICNEWYSNGDGCRHIFWSNALSDLCGSGGRVEYDDHKEAVIFFLSLYGVTFTRRLRAALLRGRYYFRFWGPLIGAGAIEMRMGRQRLDEWESSERFAGLTDEQTDLVGIAGAWLVSLWCGDESKLARTPEADAATAQWCDEFIASQGASVRGICD